MKVLGHAYRIATTTYLADESIKAAFGGARALKSRQDGIYPWQLARNRYVQAKMEMKLIHPQPDVDSTTEYVYRHAYPGMRYELPICVQGGAWPFHYEITGLPEGFTYGPDYGDANYGVIVCTSPVAGTTTGITLTVTDQDFMTVTSVFSITCATTKFKFYDAALGNNSTGDGSIGNPYQNFGKWDATNKNTAAQNNTISVHRAGTYATDQSTAMGEVQGAYYRYPMGSNKPRVFMAYPGEAVTFDMTSAKMTFYANTCKDVAFIGITLKGFVAGSSKIISMEAKADRFLAYQVSYDNTSEPDGVGGSNPNMIFFANISGKHYYIAMVDCVLTGLKNVVMSELYDVKYGLWENNLFTDCDIGLYPKLGEVSSITFRANIGVDNRGAVIRTDNYATVTGVEACWNNLQCVNLEAIKFGTEAVTQGGRWEYRNTLRVTGGTAAPIRVQNCGATAIESRASVVQHTSPYSYGVYATSYTGTHTFIDMELSSTAVTYTDANGLLIEPYRAAADYGLGHEVYYIQAAAGSNWSISQSISGKISGSISE